MALTQKQRAMEAEELDARATAQEREAADPEVAALADEAAELAATAAALVAAPASGNITLTAEQFMALMNGGGSMSPQMLASMVASAAAEAAKAVATEVRGPKVVELPITGTERRSAFNPDGEKTHPRPKLKCHMYYGSAPLGSPKETTTLTHPEIAALNALTPGHYRVKKNDGSYSVVEVRGQMNANRNLDRLWILLPDGEDVSQKNSYPPLADFAQQCRDTNRVEPAVA